MNRREFLRSALAVGAAALATGCAPAAAPAPSPTQAAKATQAPKPAATAAPAATTAPAATQAPAATKAAALPEKKDLVIGLNVDLSLSHATIAVVKGWWAEAGFTGKLETPTFTAGALAGEALRAGQLDLWIPGNVPPVSLRHNGLPVVILGTGSINANLDKLIVNPKSNIKNATDLYGKKIGLVEGSTASVDFWSLCREYKLDASKISVVNLQPPDQVSSFLSGAIDGFICWEPWPWQAQQKMPDAVIAHTGTVSNFADNKGAKVRICYNRSLICLSEQFVKTMPNATMAIMRTMVRAQKFVYDPANKEETIKLFSEYHKLPIEQNRATWDSFGFTGVMDESYLVDMKMTTDFLAETGRIKNPVDVLTYTYTDPLKAIEPAWVKLEGKWKP